VPAVVRARLPSSMLERLDDEPAARVHKLLTWLAPLTTASSPDGSRLVRGLV
jgi:hypothetical protein